MRNDNKNTNDRIDNHYPNNHIVNNNGMALVKLKHFSLPKPAHVISSFKQSLKVVVKAKMLDRSVTCFELFSLQEHQCFLKRKESTSFGPQNDGIPPRKIV